MDTPTNAVDKSIRALEDLLGTNTDRREQMLTKLMPLIEKLDIDPNNIKASELESKLGMFSTVDSLMKSMEAGSVHLAKINLSKKTEETNGNRADMVMELLKLVNPKADALGARITDTPADESIGEGELDSSYGDDGDDSITNSEIEIVQ